MKSEIRSFSELELNPLILKAIQELGFETPSAIQAQALPLLLGAETDFLGLAATGTGKTAAFGIPLLERLDTTRKEVQALVLCPTRELAIQVAGQLNLLGKYVGAKALPIYGGAGYGDQIYGLKRGGTQIVVGTPGRVVDHLNKGTLSLAAVNTLIFDEADEMFSMGFKEDLEFVLGAIPENQANIWLFSATMSPDVRRIAETSLHEPKQVQVNRGAEMVPDTVEQIYYMTQESHKPEILGKVIEAADDFYGIVFCQTKALVIDLTQHLKNEGYRADCLHGDMDQNARERTMRAFRERKFTVLIATDVACRGLDVKDITHVINYSLPRELDNYVHRIGRTGRIGKSGIAINLVTGSHRGLIGRIERLTKSKMREGRIPSRKEIAVKKIAKDLSAFETQEFHARATELLDETWKKAISGMTKEEITGRFISMMHPEWFSKAANPEPGEVKRRPVGAPGSPVSIPMDSDSGERGERGASRGRYGAGPRGGDRFGGRSRDDERGGERGAGPRRFVKKPWNSRGTDGPGSDRRGAYAPKREGAYAEKREAGEKRPGGFKPPYKTKGGTYVQRHERGHSKFSR